MGIIRQLKLKIYSFLIGALVIFQSIFMLQRCGQEASEERSPVREKEYPKVVEGLPDQVYAGTASCIECHEREFREWLGSDHDEAMMVASDTTVKGDFNEATFFNQGVSTRFFKKDGKFMVNTEGPEGKNEDFEIIYTFGTEPLQQYIVAFPRGRYQCLRIAWDTEKKKWFDLYPDMKLALQEWLHWTNGSMTWNTTCADCHSTNLHKNYFNEADSFHTTYTIIDVSCEACHGPSKDHIDYVKSNDFDSTSVYDGSDHLDMIMMSSAHQQVDDCARCHSRRVQFTKAYNHEGVFRDHYAPEILRDHIYFPDGQILDEDYVYTSFVQSKMYDNQVRCTNCHNPHTTKLKYEGNQLCLQCHEPQKYDVFEHHFHQDTEGGQNCISCHMDGRYYMVNDYRRDHSFRVPRPDLTLKYDVPNACNSCHTNQNARWASEWIIKWYGPERKKNYADVLCLGSTRSVAAVQVLDTMILSKTQPAIARATAVWYLGFIDDDQSNMAIIRSLGDVDPTVRYTAIEAMQSFPADMRYQYVAPLLWDSIRSVRVMALDALTDIPLSSLSDDLRQSYMEVLPEYKSMLEMRADFPGGQLQRARYLERQGREEEAEKALWKAISFDSLFNAARVNLAHLYHNKGNTQKAIDLFKLVTTIEPEYGPGYYSLGLLYAENDQMAEAIHYLQKAIDVEPGNPRLYYNLALAYQKQERIREAEKTFIQGLEIDPVNGELLYALTILYLQQEQYELGSRYFERLKKIYPDKARIRELDRIIQQGKQEN
jgi:predicted CXXCH cytochrome family protein